jgi:hypothetical protein
MVEFTKGTVALRTMLGTESTPKYKFYSQSTQNTETERCQFGTIYAKNLLPVRTV